MGIVFKAPTALLGTEAQTGVPYIHCLRCDRTSYHPTDVEQRYCGACKTFHQPDFVQREGDDAPPPEPCVA